MWLRVISYDGGAVQGKVSACHDEDEFVTNQGFPNGRLNNTCVDNQLLFHGLRPAALLHNIKRHAASVRYLLDGPLPR